MNRPQHESPRTWQTNDIQASRLEQVTHRSIQTLPPQFEGARTKHHEPQVRNNARTITSKVYRFPLPNSASLCPLFFFSLIQVQGFYVYL